MSNSTRPGSYDERLVVPLEASRRGAHRARTNPLVAALPLLAVVVVVAAVIGVAYAVFLRPGADPANDAAGPGTTTQTSTAPAPSSPAASTAPSTAPSGSASPSTSPAATTGTVNKNIAVTVYNGTTIKGLARRAASALTAAGYKQNTVLSGAPPVKADATTVFYSKESQAATAAAVAKALGVGKAEMTTQNIGAGLVVVTGTDANTVIP
ncbi:MAG TPA: LytR C-terminal domain-containing protein [Kineosporiaceae bacterium]|jgi:hypothetical protein|nr:LytR C-terminal domain-containing protein [Kineosporiaceae bacterium]